MKRFLRLLCLSAACSAFTLRLLSAPTTPDVLRESYVAGLGVIADTQATASRTDRLLDLISTGTAMQAQRTAAMESQLLSTRQQIDSLDRQIQSLGHQGAQLQEQRQQIETRFGALDHALADDRLLLAKSTEAVGALVASAEKSGSYVEQSMAAQTTAELKSHARALRDLADHIAQARQHISLERTLFEGLQPRLKSTTDDLKALATELATSTEKVGKVRAALGEVNGTLERDRATLSKQYQAFGVAVEGFRLVQADVLRRWLLDGPPSGDLPSLSIDDIVESGIRQTSYGAPSGVFAADASVNPNSVGLENRGVGGKASKEMEAEKSNQISAEFTQLNRRARWLLAMLDRLESFAEESLNEAEGWNGSAGAWRSQLTNINRDIADARGQLSSLQMEQDMVVTTVKLIGQQSSDTAGSVATAVKQIAAQAEKLSQLTAELKRLSAN